MIRLFSLGLLALVACAEVVAPRRLCGCSPIEPSALLAGVLTSEGGAPVSGARVQFVTRVAQRSATWGSRSAVTDSAGAFRLYAYGPAVDSAWVQIFVHDTATGTITRPAPDSVSVRFSLADARDSVWIPLTFVR